MSAPHRHSKDNPRPRTHVWSDKSQSGTRARSEGCSAEIQVHPCLRTKTLALQFVCLFVSSREPASSLIPLCLSSAFGGYAPWRICLVPWITLQWEHQSPVSRHVLESMPASTLPLRIIRRRASRRCRVDACLLGKARASAGRIAPPRSGREASRRSAPSVSQRRVQRRRQTNRQRAAAPR